LQARARAREQATEYSPADRGIAASRRCRSSPLADRYRAAIRHGIYKDRLMFQQLPSVRKLARMNRRQHKKLRVGGFQELVFEVRIRFHQPMEETRLGIFLDDFIELIESRRLVVGGLGGSLPLLATDGIVSTLKR